MANKKRKRDRQPEPLLAHFLRRHRKWVRRLGILAGLIAVLAVIWFVADPLGGTPTAIDKTGQEVNAGVIDRPGAVARSGSLAPNFVLPDYEKRAVQLDQFEGKVIFLNFWATWCTFCEEEMPDIVRIAERFPDDVVVLAVNRGESKGTAEDWTRSHRFPELLNMHWLLDTREDVVREYRVEGMPQSFFIDRSGIVAREMRRVLEYDEMLASIEGALQSSTVGLAGN